MAKFGIALGSGPRGLGFESRYSDQKSGDHICGRRFFNFYRASKGRHQSADWCKKVSVGESVFCRTHPIGKWDARNHVTLWSIRHGYKMNGNIEEAEHYLESAKNKFKN